MQLETLSISQLELLAALNFQHVPISQASMLRLLSNSWDRPRLQQVLGELQQAGWLESDWRVPAHLQESLARLAGRRKLPVPAAAPLEALRPQLTLRELRLALHGGNEDVFAFHWARMRHDFWQPFDPEWLDQLPPRTAELLVAHRVAQGRLTPEEALYLESRPDILPAETRVAVAFGALMAGRWKSAESLLEGVDTTDAQACLAFSLMQRGQAREAAQRYASARAQLRKSTGRRKVSFTNPYGWLEGLAQIESGFPAEKTRPDDLPEILERIERFAGGQSVAAPLWGPGRALEGLLQALLLAWQGRAQPQWQEECQALERAGQLWLAAEYAHLMGRGELHRQLGTRSLLTVLQPRAPWELALEALEQMLPRETPATRRLVWKVKVYRDGESLTMEPVEQKRGPKGWSEGRPVALKSLAQCDYLSAADRAICRCIRQVRTGYYGQTDIFIEIASAAAHLIGHPLVIHRDTRRPLRVRAVRPRLQCARRGQDWWLTTSAPVAYQLGEGSLEILCRSAAEVGLAQTVGRGLLVPPEGQPRFRKLLSELDLALEEPADPAAGD